MFALFLLFVVLVLSSIKTCEKYREEREERRKYEIKSFTLFSFSFIRVYGFREKDSDIEREKNYKKKRVTSRGYV
jgi:hypothetical protein